MAKKETQTDAFTEASTETYNALKCNYIFVGKQSDQRSGSLIFLNTTLEQAKEKAHSKLKAKHPWYRITGWTSM